MLPGATCCGNISVELEHWHWFFTFLMIFGVASISPLFISLGAVISIPLN